MRALESLRPIVFVTQYAPRGVLQPTMRSFEPS